jgi:hypothetical protein
MVLAHFSCCSSRRNVVQQVRGAEGMVAVALQAGVTEVVDGATVEVGQHVGSVHGFASAPLVREVPREPTGRDGVRPAQTADGAHAPE